MFYQIDMTVQCFIPKLSSALCNALSQEDRFRYLPSQSGFLTAEMVKVEPNAHTQGSGFQSEGDFLNTSFRVQPWGH